MLDSFDCDVCGPRTPMSLRDAYELAILVYKEPELTAKERIRLFELLYEWPKEATKA